MKKYFTLFLLVSFFLQHAFAQAPKKLSSDEIYRSIKKLNFLGSVLYVAAHPDDENTRMISYFSNDLHAQAAYLSITRGDGGQNLIGSEIGAPLGVIRTHELLKARSVDGGQQFFTRANDFGYSKDPEETQAIWDREKVLSDMVRVMREFQPDIVINRFDAGSAGKTHGHHTSSAILSLEAFDLAGDPNYKVSNTQPWKIKRIFFNTSWWFYGSEENFEKADKSKMLKINMGTYFPELGLSNNEIAATSRSMHKSQGFGSTGSRGDEAEYLELLKGEMPQNKENIFEGIDTSWNRIQGGKAIGALLQDVEKDYNFKNPSASVPDLIKAQKLISQLPEGHWKKIKSKEISEIIAACAGLYMEAVAEVPYASPGDSIKIKLEVINRSNMSMQLQNVRTSFSEQSNTKEIEAALVYNKRWNQKESVLLPVNSKYTSPYWLDDQGTLGMYHVADDDDIGLPLTGKKNTVVFDIQAGNEVLTFERELVYKYNDPVKGEVYEPFEVLPPLTSSILGSTVIFNDATPKMIPLTIIAHTDKVKGNATLKIPDGWRISPAEMPFDIAKKGGEQVVSFTLIPPNGQSEGNLRAVLNMGGKTYDQSLMQIEYDHIPKLSMLFPAETKVVRLDLATAKKRIAYITGAGDEVPASLSQLGYEVVEIKAEEIEAALLKNFDAVITGIRAYNIHEVLALKQPVLLEYVRNGGNMIVQYNTTQQLKVKDNLAPYALQLSNDRVTDENAEVRFLDPDQAILNYPNKISKADFEGWVQERGLYFPKTWAPEFVPVLSMNDKGESAKDGSLLIAKYGKGTYIYTGLSFFRELPAGVPGAYKLFVNLVHAGESPKETRVKN